MKGKGLVTFLSYCAIGLVAIALILAKLFSALKLSSGVVGAMELIAQIIAYSITAVFAKARKNIGWMIAFVVFVIVIIVFLVLNFNI